MAGGDRPPPCQAALCPNLRHTPEADACHQYWWQFGFVPDTLCTGVSTCLGKPAFKDLSALVHHTNEKRLLRHASDGSTLISLPLLCIPAVISGARGWCLAPMQSRTGELKEDTAGTADCALHAVQHRHAALSFPMGPAAASPATQGCRSPLHPSGDHVQGNGLARVGPDSSQMLSGSETLCKDSSGCSQHG